MDLTASVTRRFVNDVAYNVLFSYALALLKLTVLTYLAFFVLNGGFACMCNSDELRVYLSSRLAAFGRGDDGDGRPGEYNTHHGADVERIRGRAGWLRRFSAAAIRFVVDNSLTRGVASMSAYVSAPHCETLGYAVEWDDEPPGVVAYQRTSNMAYIIHNVHDNAITHIQVVFGLFRLMRGDPPAVEDAGDGRSPSDGTK